MARHPILNQQNESRQAKETVLPRGVASQLELSPTNWVHQARMLLLGGWMRRTLAFGLPGHLCHWQCVPTRLPWQLPQAVVIAGSTAVAGYTLSDGPIGRDQPRVGRPASQSRLAADHRFAQQSAHSRPAPRSSCSPAPGCLASRLPGGFDPGRGRCISAITRSHGVTAQSNSRAQTWKSLPIKTTSASW